MRRTLLAFIFVALPLARALTLAQPPRTSSIELASIDPNTDACSDFYQFACGGWVSSNPVPDRQRWGRFQEVLERNYTVLRRILEAPDAPSSAAGPSRASSREGAGDLLKARDTHAANQYRVNGVVSNMAEFRTAFSCKADAPMLRQGACRVS
jgi:predicted metalloendopeptidase